MAREPGSFNGRVRLSSDSRRTVTTSANYSWTSYDVGAWNRQISFNVNARVRERWTFSVGPSYSRSHSVSQYLSRINDPLATSTFGSRYVFSDLDRTTFSMNGRLNVTFTPTISLQLYLEPFISVGSYGAPKEFATPGTFDFIKYGTDAGTIEETVSGSYEIDPDGVGPAPVFEIRNRDFSYRSLLGNAVFRWDWRPGSTFFFVWQQRRINRLASGDHPGVGEFDLWRDADAMFDFKPDNIFMVKMNYWLNP